jgi:acyl-[acyl-carrier-protein]-phospholipid O-acyltransferase / long-chain-fatty-acid--[acyl-carrier-protein] ligase
MTPVKKSPLEWLTNLLSRLPGFSKPDKNSIHFLNLSQFMGVLNDNIFKLVIAFLLISNLGEEHASNIMAISGAIFVVPFILFSSTAGTLADKFSKQRLMLVMKVIEMALMLCAMLIFGLKSVWASYTLLFIIATHSAIFSPSKYAIIAELVPQDRVSRANGLITSFTYLGIIFGTFLASFLTQITNRNFVLVALFGFVIALIGFIGTLAIRKTPAQQSSKNPNFLFISEILATIKFCKTKKHLFLAMCGSAYFYFIGAFSQLNIIPFAINSLNLTDVAGGYLFLAIAVGIAIGSFIGGRVSKKRVELGLSCFAAFLISIVFLLLVPCCQHLLSVVILLLLLGVVGGLFVVPFDSFVQINSPDEKRGQIIGANNFLSFCGVFVSSVALYLFSEVLGFSPATGFGMVGILTLFVSFIFLSKFSDLALPFFARWFFRPTVENLPLLEKNPAVILILKNASWMKALYLMSVAENTHLLLRQTEKRRFPWFNGAFCSVHLIHSDGSYAPLLDKAKKLSAESINPCIMLESDVLPENLISTQSAFAFFGKKEFLYVDVDVNSKNVVFHK